MELQAKCKLYTWPSWMLLNFLDGCVCKMDIRRGVFLNTDCLVFHSKEWGLLH